MAERGYDDDFETHAAGNDSDSQEEPLRRVPESHTRTYRALRASAPDTVIQPIFHAQRRARIQTMLRQIGPNGTADMISRIRAVQVLAELCLMNDITDDNLTRTCALLLELYGITLNRIRGAGSTVVEVVGNRTFKARIDSIRDFEAVSRLCDDLIYLPPPVIEQDGVGGDELPPSEFVRAARAAWRF
jgi:hypothetical protein